MNRNKILWALLIIITISTIYLRVADIALDPPLYLDGAGQSLSSDPYHYTFHARNHTLFGTWDPLQDEQWRVFEYSLVSGIAYLFFPVFGATQNSSNIIGIILTMLTFTIFLFALRKLLNLSGIVLAAFLLFFNKIIYIYGGLPYAENAVLFWSAAAFLIFVEYRHQLAGKILLGAIAVLAGMSGKIFGFVIMVPIILAVWIENESNNRIKSNLTVIISAILSTLVWIVAVYGSNFRFFTDYVFNQTIGLYGFPESLSSPAGFFERLISFGAESYFYFLYPGLAAALLFSLVVLLRGRPENLRKNMPLLFLVLWFVSGYILLMIGNYRPLRYSYMLDLPITGIAAYVLGRYKAGAAAYRQERRMIWLFLFFIVIWIVLVQVMYLFFIKKGFIEIHGRLVWAAIIPAVIITLIEARYTFSRHFAKKPVQTALVGLLIAYGLFDFGVEYKSWRERESFNIREAGADIGQILNKAAVVSGPMSPTLIFDTELKGLIYAIGVSNEDPSLFKHFPVTHFAVDAALAGTIVKEFPLFMKAIPITNYWIRDANIVLYRINDATGNPTAAAYKRTDFESGRDFMLSGASDSAIIYMERFSRQFPDNKSALRSLGELYLMTGRAEDGLNAIQKAAALYPHDYSLQFALGLTYQRLYFATGDRQYAQTAVLTFRKALNMDPYQADEINQLIQKIRAFSGKK